MNRSNNDYVKFVAGGGIAALGFLFPCWCLFLISFGWFSYRIFYEKRKFSIRSGFVYWLSFFVGSLYWLVYPLTIDLKNHGILIPFAILVIPAYLSAQLLIPIYIAKRNFENIWVHAVVFSVSTFLIMYFCGHYAPGFPWILPGYVWSENEITLQTFSLWGIYGQTFLTTLLGSFLGICFYQYRRASDFYIPLVIVGGFITFFYIFGYARLFFAKTEFTDYKIRSVQASLLQKNKMNPNLREYNFDLHINLSNIQTKEKSKTNSESEENKNLKFGCYFENRKNVFYEIFLKNLAEEFCNSDFNFYKFILENNSEKLRDPDFIIWPEASIPYLFTDNSYYLKGKLVQAVPQNGYLIAGAVRKNSENDNIYNSVIIVDHSGEKINCYDKKRLVPFGEYVPFRKYIPKIFAPIANSIGDFSVGKNSNIIELKNLKIAFAICYEAIFSGEFIPENRPVDVIINVTNDAWFGHTSELMQHFRIVQARAVEEGVPLIRTTNFGISAIFDSYGREIKSLSVDEVGVIDCFVPEKLNGTFFKKIFSFFRD